MAEVNLLARQHKVLSREESSRLVREGNFVGFRIYSDNILEGLAGLDLICEDQQFLTPLGVSYKPIDQPIYFFKDRAEEAILGIKVCGDYANWAVPPMVEKAISYIDKMDFVVVDMDDKPVIAGETTGTANVGNSQWQREGRKVGAAVNQIPFVYQTYYAGTDRSQKGGPVIREPTSLQVLNHIVYSLRYQVPSFVVYYANPELDKQIGKNRSQTKGKELMSSYLAVSLLSHTAPGKYLEAKKRLEKSIVNHMLDYVTEPVLKRERTVTRLDNDFPNLPKRKLFFAKKAGFIDFIVERINCNLARNESFNFLSWDISKFSRWGATYYKLPLIKEIGDVIPIFSYLARTKVGIVQNTERAIQVLGGRLSAAQNKIERCLQKGLPTLIIPTRMFKGTEKILAGDPESGEITAFSELFSRTLWGEKSMNVVIYVHVDPPAGFSVIERIHGAESPDGSKLFKAIKHYADCLIVKDKLFTWS